MGRKVEWVSRGKSGKKAVVREGAGAHPAATSEQVRKSRCPSRKREGSQKALTNPFMPGLRIREDGWTVARTRTFLALLARTGCVADAARVAGVSTTSVNRSRKLFAPFDRACVEALAKALRGLEAVAYQRAVEGRETIVIRDGREVERRIVPSDSMLKLLIQRGDLAGLLGRALSPAEAEAFVLPEAARHRFIDRAESERGIVFEDGVKQPRRIATQQEVDAIVLRRIALAKRVGRAGAAGDPDDDADGEAMPLDADALDAAWAAEEARRGQPPSGAA